MKTLIKTALDATMALVDNQVPTHKAKTMYSDSIMNVNPLDMAKFMKDNDIPSHATFDGTDGYDGDYADFVLSWNVSVPTTDADKLAFKKKRFNSRAFKFVYDTMIGSGYTRKVFDSIGYRDFKKANDPIKLYGNRDYTKVIYDMYVAGDYDRLVNYYSLFFNKIDDK